MSLTPADILEVIRQRRELGTSREQVAKDFNISKRTVTRICNGDGEAFSKILKESPYKPRPKIPRLNPLPRGYDKNHNEFVNFKRKFGFAFELPVLWGAYNSYDGKHEVGTDGIIMWLSSAIARKAQDIANLGDPKKPFMSDQVKELDTFEVAEIMDAPIGEPLHFERDDLNGLIHYRTHFGRPVVIAEKFARIAYENGFLFYDVETAPNRVFMVKMKEHVWDPQDGIHACIATISL